MAISPKWTRDGKGNSGATGLTAKQWVLNRAQMEKDGTFDVKAGPACVRGHKACSCSKSVGGPCRLEMTAVMEGREFTEPKAKRRSKKAS